MSQPTTDRDRDVTTTTGQFERAEDRRVLLYIVIAIPVILLLGFIAGVLDDALRAQVDTNAFLENSREILQVIASSAPWLVLFIVLCSAWVWIADTLFKRWNRALGRAGEQDKGLIYELVHDNNSAAALMLLVPMIIIALGLIYVSLLNLPYNLSNYITTIPTGTPRP
jgi:hypothetical protein